MKQDLTLSQLESLAQAWFDCRLDEPDEAALRRVLSASAARSELLDECRMAMGLELTAARRGAAAAARRRLWLRAGAAAAVAVALGFAAFSIPRGEQVEVYVDGHRVDDRARARSIAETRMRQSEEELRQTRQMALNLSSEAECSEQFFRQTLQNIPQQ